MNNIKHKAYRATPIHVITNTKNGACLLFDRKGQGINSSRWSSTPSISQLTKILLRSLIHSQKHMIKNLTGFSSSLSANLR